MLHRQSLGFIIYFMRAYPARSALMVVCLLLSGLFEGIGVATLLPLLELATEGGVGGETGLGELVRDLLAVFGLEPAPGVLLGLIVAGLACKAILLWIAMRQVGYTVAKVTADLRLSLIRALLEARWPFFVSQPTGYFANAMGTEALRASGASNLGLV